MRGACGASHVRSVRSGQSALLGADGAPPNYNGIGENTPLGWAMPQFQASDMQSGARPPESACLFKSPRAHVHDRDAVMYVSGA